MTQSLYCGRFELSLERPLIMGIVNVTPDSFADGKPCHVTLESAVARAHQLIADGADILDIGGESTRPGAHPVSEEEERHRILPVIKALSGAGVPLSVDTAKPQIMREALDAGADMINDISGFRSSDAIAAVADSRCGLCVMHMQGEPRTMQLAPHYDDVASDIRVFLEERCTDLRNAGVASRRLLVDPGFGFGKTVEQNYELLRRLPEACVPGIACLVGVSRKAMIGHVTHRPPVQRVAGSLAAALAAIQRGAHVLRVHDVAQTRDAIKVWLAIERGVIDD